MISKVSAAGASVAVFSSLVGRAAAMPLSMRAAPIDVLPRSEDAVALPPLTWYNGIGNDKDAKLYNQETMYWGDNGVLATVTCEVEGDDRRMLNVARLGDMVESLDCSTDSGVTMKFKDQQSMHSVQSSWTWVDNADGNAMVVVVDGEECGGPNGRQPYIINHVEYDQGSLTANMQGVKDKWVNFITGGKLRVSSQGAEGQEGSVQKRAAGTLNFDNEFSRNIVSTSFENVNLELNCAECRTQGAVDYDLELDLNPFSSDFGVDATVTTRNNFGARIVLGITASGALTREFDAGSINLLTVPLTPFTVAGIAEFGPQFTVNGQARISSLDAEVTTQFGGQVTIPDGKVLRLLGDSDSLDPQFESVDPSLSGSLTITASLTPSVTLEMAARVFGRGAVVGFALEAPFIEATARAEATTEGGVCQDPNGFAGVSFNLDIGARLNFFGGLGERGEQPNAKELLSFSQPIVDVCLAVGGGQGGGEQPQQQPTNEPAFDENILQDGSDGRPKVGTATYSNGESRDLFNFGALSDDTPIPAVDGATVTSVRIDAEAAGIASCEVHTSISIQTTVTGFRFAACDGFIQTVNNGQELSVQNAACIRCANIV